MAHSVTSLIYLSEKNPHSLIASLGRITGISSDGRNYQIQLLNRKSVTRQLHHIVPTQANFNVCTNESLDPFQLQDVSIVIVLSMVSSDFYLNLDKFDVGSDQVSTEDLSVPVSSIKLYKTILPSDFSQSVREPVPESNDVSNVPIVCSPVSDVPDVLPDLQTCLPQEAQPQDLP